MGRLEDRTSKHTEKVEEEFKVTQPEPQIVDVRPAKVVKEIQRNPVRKGILTEKINGIPIDWHDLENFIVSLSPQHFANTLKLQEQKVRRKELSYVDKERKPFPVGILIGLAILVVVGIILMVYGPQIMAMFGG